MPENLYDKPHGLELIASPGVTAAYAVALYLLTAAAFAGFAAFYSHPSQHVTEVFVQRDYARAGFACEPSNERQTSVKRAVTLSADEHEFIDASDAFTHKGHTIVFTDRDFP